MDCESKSGFLIQISVNMPLYWVSVGVSSLILNPFFCRVFISQPKPSEERHTFLTNGVLCGHNPERTDIGLGSGLGPGGPCFLTLVTGLQRHLESSMRGGGMEGGQGDGDRVAKTGEGGPGWQHFTF